MPHYRLYFLMSGHIRQAEDLDRDDDEAAIAAADARADGRAMELWQAERMVRLWPKRSRPTAGRH